MAQSTLVIIITLVTLVVYAFPFVPISITTVLAVLACAATGAISFGEALSGFSSSAVFLVAGMMIVGKACYASGLAALLGKKLYRFTGRSERRFIVIMFAIVSVMCALINTTAVLALMMPVLDSISASTDGRISRKMTYFPLGIASVLGSGLSTISSSSMIAANELLIGAGLPTLGLFTPAIVNLPSLLVVLLFFGTVGYDLMKKVFDFEEVAVYSADGELQNEDTSFNWKMLVSGGVMVAMVIGFLLGFSTSGVSLLAACVVILTGCISEKEALKDISWSTIVIVGASIGLGTAIDKSGAGAVMAQAMLDVAGPIAHSTLGLSIILFFVASVLSNLLADTGTVAMLMPLIFSLSATLGLDPIPLTLAMTSGVKTALATPICTANMTMIKTPGYRFMDYVKIGGLVNIICMVVTCVVIAVVYGF